MLWPLTFDLLLQGAAGDEKGGHPDPSRSSLLQHRSLRGGAAGVQRGCRPAARQHWHLAGSGEHTHTLHHGMLWHLCVQQKQLFLVSHTHSLTVSPRQSQVLAMAGRTKEAEKMTLDIISREGSCIECYRLLSAIYSKRGNYTEVCVYACVCISWPWCVCVAQREDNTAS